MRAQGVRQVCRGGRSHSARGVLFFLNEFYVKTVRAAEYADKHDYHGIRDTYYAHMTFIHIRWATEPQIKSISIELSKSKA